MGVREAIATLHEYDWLILAIAAIIIFIIALMFK
jgi:uncharacterized protein involved in exopolysaccharide biosynthesis